MVSALLAAVAPPMLLFPPLPPIYKQWLCCLLCMPKELLVTCGTDDAMPNVWSSLKELDVSMNALRGLGQCMVRSGDERTGLMYGEDWG